MNGWEVLLLWLCCAIPVVCSTILCLALGLFCWRIVARMESANRDMLKAVLVLSNQQAAGVLAGMMEQGDAAVQRAALDGQSAKGAPLRRQAQ